MTFKIKCFLQQLFSNLPKGEKLNYFFQKKVLKNLPPTDNQVLTKINWAFDHYQKFKKYNKLEVNTNKYYEFGTGWNLTIPLSMSFLNFNVYCIDIRNNLKTELSNHNIDNLKNLKDQIPFTIDENKLKYYSSQNFNQELKDNYNIDYQAPQDGRNTNYKDNYFDFMSSSVTLEHIPKNDIELILKECFRILKKGGILSMIVDYQDHWSYFDKSINAYNFLQYSDAQWKKYNPSLHYQNRLRHKDYINIIKNSGFKLVEEVLNKPSEQDLKDIQALSIDKKYKYFSDFELGIRSSKLVLLKE